jgi:hypothetical protein
MADEKLIRIAIVAGVVIGLIGALLLVILLPMSFSYLDFYEVRLKKTSLKPP